MGRIGLVVSTALTVGGVVPVDPVPRTLFLGGAYGAWGVAILTCQPLMVKQLNFVIPFASFTKMLFLLLPPVWGFGVL